MLVKDFLLHIHLLFFSSCILKTQNYLVAMISSMFSSRCVKTEAPLIFLVPIQLFPSPIPVPKMIKVVIKSRGASSSSY